MRKERAFPTPLIALVAVVCVFMLCETSLAESHTSATIRPILTYTKGNGDWIGVYHGEFRVDVFADGSAIYEGFRKVRLSGIHRYQLTEEEYRALLRVVHNAQFRLLHNKLYPRTTIAAMIVNSYTALYFNISSGSGDILLMREVESHLKVRSLRCPYTLTGDRPGDVCEIEYEIENRPEKAE